VNRVIARWVFGATCFVILSAGSARAQTQDPSTSDQSYTCATGERLSRTFDNGAGWDLCVDNRVRENLVLSNVQYRDVQGRVFPVLASAGISQLHVSYDDSDVTYNDVTQYGLGEGYLLDLSAQDCPNGVILTSGNRASTCVTDQSIEPAHRTQNRRALHESLNLFSVSQVGAYTYVLDWTLFDDGTIEPAVGATGALQRSSSVTEQPFGRVLSEDPDVQWLSHTHNYYWRLDFDLGDQANDDVVVETTQARTEDGKRVTTRTRFTQEQARRINPDEYQSWRLYEFSNDADAARGYEIAPIRHGHRLTRPDVEPYTDFDFFVTVANDCERFASQNALFNPECTDDVLQFANDESLVDQDIVAWHRVAFHHVPRNEDQRHMHAHWDAFSITPVNVNDTTPSAVNLVNAAPVVVTPGVISATIGEAISRRIEASDPDDDALHFHAHDLPNGITLSHDGEISGVPTEAGSFITPVSVSDDLANVMIEQRFDISGDGNSANGSGGFFGAVSWVWLMLLGSVYGFRRGR